MILGQVVANVACEPVDEDDIMATTEDGCADPMDTYILIAAYATCKFLNEMINYLREVPFAYIMASAEQHIAELVYRHVTNLSLAFHLSRETGKIVKIVSKGAHAFAMVLRYMLFSILPVIVEVIFILVSIGVKYDWLFLLVNLGCIVLYLIVTFAFTEWRAKHFKQ